MTTTSNMTCPVCDGVTQESLLTVERAPITCAKLFQTREAALLAGTCSLQIMLCAGCGHVWNAAHQKSTDTLYDEGYYSSKAASSQARQYQEDLAGDLDRLVGMRDKTVLEVGCGDGLFLQILNAAGAKGIGFEPSSTYQISKGLPGIDVVNEPFPFDGSPDLESPVDLVVMRHVLEHLASPQKAVYSLRKQSLGCPGPQYLFLEVPNVFQLLEERLYFDFYNDHIHYFSHGSLAHLLKSTGWIPLDRTDGPPEFLGMVSANADYGHAGPDEPKAPANSAERQPITEVAMEFRRDLEQWKSQLINTVSNCRGDGQRVAVWGAGSRGVALLAGLELPGEAISYVVDTDPNKHGKYLPMFPEPIRSPEHLRQDPVDCVLVTSYTYFDEICGQLDWFRSAGGKVIRVYPTPQVV